MKRRSFLKVVGGVTGTVALGVAPILVSESEAAAGAANGEMPKRVLGRTGFKVSVVGFAGLALTHYPQDECTRGVHKAFDRGLNYYDVAPAYGKDGACEIKMGEALQGLDRSRYILACKTKMRDKDGCRLELERSLKRLKTDHFDLYQMHHLVKPEDVKKALGPGGALETILKAKEEGKIRAIGFSAHTTKAALEALRGFNYDTVMFPISFAEYYTRGFGKEVLALAKEKGAAVLSIKTLHSGAWPQGAERTRQWWYRPLEKQEDINLAYRWTLSLPGVVAGFPPSFLDLQDKSIEAGLAYRPATEADAKKLEEMAQGSGSIFKREEDSVASVHRYHSPYPHSPHECCEGEWA
ncbi:MAG: aldo/keto reductase [Verrucomicrobia bacterium]|nr:aldo/keto reductase [Verrucomicrobiota bacterium]